MLNYIRRLLGRPERLPNARPLEHPCLLLYDLREDLDDVYGYPFRRLASAAYCGEPNPVLAVVNASDRYNHQGALLVVNLRKMPHDYLKKNGLLHLVEE